MSNIFKSAIFSSHSITEDYFNTNSLNSLKLNPIAITAEKIHAPSWMTPDIKRKGIAELISNRIDKKISVKFFNPENRKDINGMCVENRQSAEIYVSDKLNFCYKRFIIAKELSHLLMNHHLKNLRIDTKTNTEFKNIISFLLTNSEGDTDAKISERIAYYGAMELLIPKCYTESDEFNNCGNNELAEKIKVPTQIIEIRKSTQQDFQPVYTDEQFPNARMLDLISRTNKN